MGSLGPYNRKRIIVSKLDVHNVDIDSVDGLSNVDYIVLKLFQNAYIPIQKSHMRKKMIAYRNKQKV